MLAEPDRVVESAQYSIPVGPPRKPEVKAECAEHACANQSGRAKRETLVGHLYSIFVAAQFE